ncbi:acyltransferase family protein [Lapidilactobacillus bayanensis]|uniref:acyltransferase family protein n=1 Tax=Lapidilactobacillus bayanensis TaxID=2485998 RepID=UPI000F782BCB|nr:acyltransferase family protein [Lapidilactobacillus bayanensis]
MRIKWFSFVRITGLILVLTYHFFKNLLPGGFIGVDIFFTFSGYLITALMIDEFHRHDGFNLQGFYRRRFYRIVPPLVLSILLVIPFTYLISRDYVTDIGKQITAALGFTTNFYEIATGGSYETNFIPHLFVHTWSLAVEMHYYIIWGLCAFVIAKLIKHGQQQRSTTRALLIFKLSLFVLSSIFLIASFAAMVIGSLHLKEFSPVYFSTLTHCFPFFLGSCLGILVGIRETSTRFKVSVQRWSAPAAIVVLVLSFMTLLGLSFTLQFDQRTTYFYGFLAASLLACVMIYAARILHEKTPTVAEPKLISFLADTSYSVYLFHWPFFVIFSHVVTTNLAVILTLVFSLFFSALSYYILEPLIAGKALPLQDQRITQALKKQFVQIIMAVIVVALTVVSAYTAYAAPTMTSLETNLWTGSLYQDADQLKTAHQSVLAAIEAKKQAAIARKKKLAAKTALEKAQAEEESILNAVPKGVSIIGDSVTLGTRQYLGAHVANSSIDAAGNRTMDLAYKVMMNQQKNHILRQYVVIAIGTNALNDWQLQTDKVINSLGKGHHLILMTPHDGSANATYNSEKLAVYERTLPRKYPWITIADWNSLAKAHPEVFKGSDGTHFGGNAQGNILFAQCVNDALIAAKKQPIKK